MKMDTLSPEAISRIWRLNACLLTAANRTEDRAKQTQAAYLAGGGVEDYRQRGEYWEDYELEAVIKCSLGKDDPAFNPDDEYSNIIAATTSFGLPTEKDGLAWNDCDHDWREGSRRLDVFRQTRFCYLFHDIYDHTLHNDLDALLRIGEIEIDLVLLRQRGTELDKAFLPRKRKRSYSRSVFSQTPCASRRNPLTYRELRYARLLNKKLHEGHAWLLEQAYRNEREYGEIGGLDRHLTEDNAYEDYEMMMRVDGFLGENHPEYDENENNLVVTHNEPVYKKSQYIFGRSRNPFHHNRYGSYFTKNNKPRSWGDNLNRISPCGLFWDIFEKADRDWLKMLSIGALWFEVCSVQRRIVQV